MRKRARAQAALGSAFPLPLRKKVIATTFPLPWRERVRERGEWLGRASAYLPASFRGTELLLIEDPVAVPIVFLELLQRKVGE